MLNVVALMGRLTADPELRHTPNGVAVTTITLAVSRAYVSKGNERQTDFIDVVAWRGTAEFICRYFHKGQMMAINGSMQTRTYTDKEGHNRKAVEVVADNAFFTESKSSFSGNTTGNEPRQSAEPTQGAEPATFESGSADDFALISGDDDLPF